MKTIHFRFLFWVEPYGTPAIGRSYMDGKGKVYIIAENLKRPNGLTIDYTCKYDHTFIFLINKICCVDEHFIIYMFKSRQIKNPCFSKPTLLDGYRN